MNFTDLDKELEELIKDCNNKEIRLLALCVYDTRKDIKHIKLSQSKIFKFITIGYSVISILLSILIALSYIRL